MSSYVSGLMLFFLGLVSAVETIDLPCIADTSIVLYPGEERECHGVKSEIRIKGNQHIVALDFAWSALRGRHIVGAELVCQQGVASIVGVTVSTIMVPWQETSVCAAESGIAGQAGWGIAGRFFPAVAEGNGGSRCATVAPAVPIDGVYRWPVAPELIEACVSGFGYGLAVHEVSSDYSRNPTIFSRESGRGPRLLVQVNNTAVIQTVAPRVELFNVNGEPWVTLTTTPAASGLRVVSAGTPVPAWRIPAPSATHSVVMQVPRTGRFEVSAVDRAGNSSPATVVMIPVVSQRTRPALDGSRASVPVAGALVASGVAAVPITDGQSAAGIAPERRRANPVFDGAAVRLRAAAGEVACVQVLVRGTAPTTATLTVPGVSPRLSIAHEVTRADGRRVAEMLMPLTPTSQIVLRPEQDAVVVVEMPIPFSARPGRLAGELTFSDGRRLPLEVTVLDLKFPEKASFICEMNGYGLPDSVAEFMAFQWAAYERRCHINLLPYSHRTASADARRCTMDMRLATGQRMDEARFNRIAPGATHGFWDDFDSAFGPYLSGSAFADGHRGAIPAPGFYLPFHESWPLPLRPYWNGNVDAAKAFAEHPEYATTFVAILTDFMRHAQVKKWTNTEFQVYCNNKGDVTDPKKGPWILDEPTAWWDYRALDWYGGLVTVAKKSVPAVQVDFRVDMSRPEFLRGQLAQQVGLWVVADGAQLAYPEAVMERVVADRGRLWLYGGAAPVGSDNMANAAWVLSAFQRGADGVVPWLTIDMSGEALSKGIDTALFVADRSNDEFAVRSSLRLLSFLAGEQAVEYLNLLAQKGWSRAELATLINAVAPLQGTMTVTGDGDAGMSGWALHPDALFRLQTVAEACLKQP